MKEGVQTGKMEWMANGHHGSVPLAWKARMVFVCSRAAHYEVHLFYAK
jgi:hypothetical protein